MKIQALVQIDASPTQVWAMITQPAMMVLWQDGYESTVMKQGNPGETNSIAQHVFKDKGKTAKVEEEILSLSEEKDKRSSLSYPVMNQRMTYVISGTGPVTLECTIEFEMKAFSLRLMWPWLKKSFQSKLEGDLERLQQRLEATALEK